MASGHYGAVLQQIHRLYRGGSVAGLAEGQLLERFVTRRDEAAFEALVARHGPMVLTVCRRLLRNPHDVDDAFQATFLILVRKASSIRQRDLLANWLYGVAHRVAARARANAARRLAHERLRVERAIEDKSINLPNEDLQPVLHEEVNRLPANYRAPIVLCYLDGLTHEEAAAQLRCPIGTVKSRLARARQVLKRRLIRRGLGVSAAVALSTLSEQTARAAVPQALVNATVKAALVVAAGRAGAAGAVSASVFELTRGVLKTMFLSKMKIALAMSTALGVIATGAGVLAYQETEKRPPNNQGEVGSDRNAGEALKRSDRLPVQDLGDAQKTTPAEEAKRSYPPQGESTAQIADELELLQIQVVTKEAELKAEDTLLERAKQSLAQALDLRDKGALPISQVHDLETAVTLQEVRLAVKQGELKEAQIRLRQGGRRFKIPNAAAEYPFRRSSSSPSTDLERRVGELERKVDQLRNDLDAVRRDPHILGGANKRDAHPFDAFKSEVRSKTP